MEKIKLPKIDKSLEVGRNSHRLSCPHCRSFDFNVFLDLDKKIIVYLLCNGCGEFIDNK